MRLAVTENIIFPENDFRLTTNFPFDHGNPFLPSFSLQFTSGKWIEVNRTIAPRGRAARCTSALVSRRSTSGAIVWRARSSIDERRARSSERSTRDECVRPTSALVDRRAARSSDERARWSTSAARRTLVGRAFRRIWCILWVVACVFSGVVFYSFFSKH